MTLPPRSKTAGFGGLLVLLLPLATIAAPVAYSIQVGAFSTSQSAEAALATYGTGEEPAYLLTPGAADGYYRVVKGAFETYWDAWALREQMGEGFIVAVPRSQAPDVTPTLPAAGDPARSASSESLPEMMLRLGAAPAVELSQGSPAINTADASASELLHVGVNAPLNSDGIPALQAFLDRFPGHTKSPQARLRLARRLLGRGETAAARGALAPVLIASDDEDEKALARLILAYSDMQDAGRETAIASFAAIGNDVATPHAVRTDALRRAAGLLHAERRYSEAWTHFRQLAHTAQDPAIAADAKVQLAGLAYELVESGKGTWGDVRRLCREITKDSEAPGREQATAALMYAETYFKEGRLAEAVSAADALLSAHGDQPREAPMAKALKGAALARLGDFPQANAVLSEVAAGHYTDTFAGENPRAIALSWQAWIAHRNRDSAEVHRIAATLQEDFPGLVATERARSMARQLPH